MPKESIRAKQKTPEGEGGPPGAKKGVYPMTGVR